MKRTRGAVYVQGRAKSKQANEKTQIATARSPRLAASVTNRLRIEALEDRRLLALVTIDPGDYSGKFRVDNGASIASSTAVDLAEGAHSILIDDTGFNFNVDDSGVVTAPVGREGVSFQSSGSSLTFNTATISFDPGSYSGKYLVASPDLTNATGSRTVEMVPGVNNYQVRIDDTGFRFNVDDSGVVTAPAGREGVSFQSSGSSLTFNTATIFVEPVDFSGLYNLASPSSANTSGSRTVEMVPGVGNYQVRIGNTGVRFNINDDGQPNPTSVDVTVGSGTHTFLLSAQLTLSPGNILVADFDKASSTGSIIKIDPISGSQTLVSSGGYFKDPAGLALDGDGQIIVSDRNAFGGSGGIIRVDPATGIQTIVSSGGSFTSPATVTIDDNGDLIVADFSNFGGSGSILRVDPVSGAQTTISSGGSFVDPYAIAFDSSGDLFVADLTSGGIGSVLRVDVTTGAQTLVSTGGNLVDPTGMGIDSNGNIVVSDLQNEPVPGGSVIRINPNTGAQTVVVSGTVFLDPTGLAIEADGNILVADIGERAVTGTIFRVNPSTGVATALSTGGLMIDPVNLMVIPFPNSPPTADAGGPYSVVEGSAVQLDASGSSDPNQSTSSLTFHWDLDGDGVFGETGGAAARGDEVGATPTFSAAGLDGPSSVTVSLKVVDDEDVAAASTATINIVNIAPVVTAITNTSPECGGVQEGDQASITAGFSDVGTPDTHTATIAWGDGTSSTGSVSESNGVGTVTGNHIYVDGGIYTVTVTVTDDDSGSAQATTTTMIVGAGVNGDVLQVVGSNVADKVTINKQDADTFKVIASFLASNKTFAAGGVSKIHGVFCDGDDQVTVASSITIPARLEGGEGDDKLKGGGGNDVILGGLGDDLLLGKNGRDLLVGGAGADRIVGNADDDILVAGYLNFAATDQAIDAIMAEWTSTRDYATRVANISGTGTGTRDNANYFLTTGSSATVLDDGARDVLTGSAGQDWFFANLNGGVLDKITDLDDDEFADDLDWILAP